jgi:hypothetical protein
MHISRPGSTLSIVDRDSWDDIVLERGVVDLSESFRASKTHITICGHITPTELQKELRPRDLYNGHCNRHEYVYCERRKIVDEDAWTDEQQTLVASTRRQYEDECVSAIKTAMTWLREIQPKDGNDGKEFRLDDEARKEMREFNRYYNGLQETSPLAHLFSRAIAIIKRSAMVNAIMACSERIRGEDIRAAIAEWEYCRACAEFIFAYTVKSQAEIDLDALHAWAIKRRQPVSARDVTKSGPQPFRNAEAAELGLNRLTKCNPPRGTWGDWIRNDKGGPPTRYFTAIEASSSSL